MTLAWAWEAGVFSLSLSLSRSRSLDDAMDRASFSLSPFSFSFFSSFLTGGGWELGAGACISAREAFSARRSDMMLGQGRPTTKRRELQGMIKGDETTRLLFPLPPGAATLHAWEASQTPIACIAHDSQHVGGTPLAKGVGQGITRARSKGLRMIVPCPAH
jgi:hypothetical protein